MVVVRYVLGTSTIWQNEFVTFAVVAATLFGSPYVLLTKGHVNVDLLPPLPWPLCKALARSIRILTRLACLRDAVVDRLAVFPRSLGGGLGDVVALGSTVMDSAAAAADRPWVTHVAVYDRHILPRDAS